MKFETLKHRFFELTQVAFWDGQEAEYEFKVKCDPFETSLFRLHPSRILGWLRAGK